MTNQKKRILVIEDTPEISKVVTYALEKAGFEVDNCLNGIDGIKKIKADHYSLILLDLVMPGKTGFEIMHELKMLQMNPPIMIYSNLPEEFTKEEALKLGAKDYFEKSKMSIQDLVEKVKKYSST